MDSSFNLKHKLESATPIDLKKIKNDDKDNNQEVIKINDDEKNN